MKKFPLAIIDYGIGGLGLLKIIRKDFPTLPIVYFSDSGQVPYGKMSRQTLRARQEKVWKFLFDQGVELIIVACHSASSVVKPTDRNVIGLRKTTVNTTVKRRAKTVGIIGGGRTIRSRYYSTELKKRGIKSRQRVAQPLSILIERGEINTPLVDATVKAIMKALKNCDSILLACTHYPVLSEVIQKHAGAGAKLIDPIEDLYKELSGELKAYSKKYKGATKFYTSGNPKLMIEAARKAFGVQIHSVSIAKL